MSAENLTTEELVDELTRRDALPRCGCGRWRTYIGVYDRDGRTLRCRGCLRAVAKCRCGAMSDVQARLAAIAARADAATPGPWVVETPENVYGYDGGTDWADLRWVSNEATVADDDPPWIGPVGTSDAAFIAAARQDVPALVAFAQAVLALCDANSDALAVSTFTLRRLADEHLGGDD